MEESFQPWNSKLGNYKKGAKTQIQSFENSPRINSPRYNNISSRVGSPRNTEISPIR
mgnify:CR=1 FL=1